MSDIGVEVGQKMRSAVKAKLMELECYVDDELPDYIMVMVANKRTKSQMNEDLQLFLGSKTSTFVEWLHIVLKKLKEVHVTNPNVFKKAIKRKIEDPDLEKHIKKEKKESKTKKPKKKDNTMIKEEDIKSLTDDLPMNISKLSESRKVVFQETSTNESDNFNIPTITEVTLSDETESRIVEKQFKTVKSRLGVVVRTETDDDFLNIKAEPDDLFPNEQSLNKKEKQQRKVNVVDESLTPPIPQEKNLEVTVEMTPSKPKEKSRIVYDLESNAPKKKSVLERLGKRRDGENEESDFRTGSKRPRVGSNEARRVEEDKLVVVVQKVEKERKRRNDEKSDQSERESALSRLGVLSKVAVPKKPTEEEENEKLVNKEVPSTVKVKPRVIPPNAPQANKTLLLKAVADAQRSVAQTPSVGAASKPDGFFTKKYKEKFPDKNQKRKKSKSKLQDIISHISKNLDTSPKIADSNDSEYVPKPIRQPISSQPQYIPSPKDVRDGRKSPNFIVTLDGIDKKKFEKQSVEEKIEKRPPSPIVFDMVSSPIKKTINVPDVLPEVHTSPSVKNKERCKYWPTCRQGEKCEFVHPSTPCKVFPQCKFGDKCLYIHPNCKFESSCTRRDCPYNHSSAARTQSLSASQAPKTLQTCKFFPNCTNVHCTFYHPRPCKFGKFCKNQAECTFLHPRTSNLTWRSRLQV